MTYHNHKLINFSHFLFFHEIFLTWLRIKKSRFINVNFILYSKRLQNDTRDIGAMIHKLEKKGFLFKKSIGQIENKTSIFKPE